MSHLGYAAHHTVYSANSFIGGFKNFIGNKNVLDMAIGVVIAQTFGKIVTSLVEDIIMPLLALAMGKTDLTEIVWTLREADGERPAVVMNAGVFISAIIHFLFVALCFFVIVEVLTSMRKRAAKRKKKEEALKEPTTEEKTLVALQNIESLLQNISDNKPSET